MSPESFPDSLEHDFLAPELKFILNHAEAAFRNLQGKRVFLTGGTGFIGTWLIKSFIHANRELALKSELIVLSRNPEAYLIKNPGLRHQSDVHFVKGSLTELPPIPFEFHFVIHGAANAHSSESREDKVNYELSIEGTRQLLSLFKSKRIERFLFLSSGAVYGTQPSDLYAFTEGNETASEDLNAALEGGIPLTPYVAGKIAAEKLLAQASSELNFDLTIARIFAVFGPYMALDSSYAIGNFVSNAVKNLPIQIKGDGTPLRNPVYVADLVVGLWNLLILGQNQGAYNIAGDETVSIANLANLVKDESVSKIEIIIEKKATGLPSSRYTGDSKKMRSMLNLQCGWTLKAGIKRTIEWVRHQQDTNE